MHKAKLLLFMLLFLLPELFSLQIFAGTTGKIAGIVRDKETGEPIPGANITIEGTSLGAAADMDGSYIILQVPPGEYSLTASVIGYAKMVVSNVRVEIDQTTQVNFTLSPEVIEAGVVTIVAERKAVKVDVSASVTSIAAAELTALPTSDVMRVAGLQAGVQGLNIRGSEANKSLFMVDGITMRDPRNNNPISTLPLSSVQEISVKRGGFEAEYGQVQSGLFNVVTKEGSRDKYHVSFTHRYSPPRPKYFGISPFDKESMWFKPYLDDQVAWVGTKAGWDEYTRRQYPEFVGWNEISRLLLEDNNPNNDLSPVGAQQVWLWEHRKRPVTDMGDYDIDAGLGGPVPLIGHQLGDLRFFTSYRRHREALLVPLTRPDYVDYDYQLQLISDLSPSMKLRFTTLLGKRYSMADNWNYAVYPRYPYEIAGFIIGDRDGDLFSTGHFSYADIGHRSFNLKLTHTLSSKTFYEVSVEQVMRDYSVRAPAQYDTTKDNEVVPGYFVDDAPFGYHPGFATGIAGMLFGGHSSRQRDNSQVSATTFKADVTSQVTHQHQLKAGVEFVSNLLDLDYGFTNGTENYLTHVQRKDRPIRAAMYLQDKLEAKGFIVNMGLRLDYSNSNTDWYDLNPYDREFFSTRYSEDKTYATKATESQYQLSPRLGISHPVTENSKLFFNYGHFKQMPRYETLFRIQRSPQGQLSAFGDPNLVLAKTIAYELGYDHSLSDVFLVQLAAYYKDITDQERTVSYYGIKDVQYTKVTNNGYSDIRGFELSLRKMAGRWWSGFANYTYQVTTSGHFGRDEVYQNPSAQQQYDRATQNLYQNRPIPQPYARANLSFHTPKGFGPKLFGIYPLEALLFTVLGDWQDGGYITYNPLDPAVTNNVKVVNYYNVELRLNKTVNFKNLEVDFFVDVYNALNTRRLATRYGNNLVGEYNYQDRIDYMNSLHLPENTGYSNVVGDDKFGDYRKDDVKFQPIEPIGAIKPEDTGKAGVIYWERATRRYYEYVKVEDKYEWREVEKARMDKILKEKAYIDMPNRTSFNFFDPRDVFLGVRMTINL